MSLLALCLLSSHRFIKFRNWSKENTRTQKRREILLCGWESNFVWDSFRSQISTCVFLVKRCEFMQRSELFIRSIPVGYTLSKWKCVTEHHIHLWLFLFLCYIWVHFIEDFAYVPCHFFWFSLYVWLNIIVIFLKTEILI